MRFCPGQPYNLTQLFQTFHEEITNVVSNCSYGYRGKDSRDNLFRLPSGELVYNMAGVVVLHDYENTKQRHYTEHSDDVKW